MTVRADAAGQLAGRCTAEAITHDMITAVPSFAS
jgi:hypothetical protein